MYVIPLVPLEDSEVVLEVPPIYIAHDDDNVS